MRGVSMDNKNQKQFAGGTVGKGKKYTLHIDEYMQAMAIARTFFKPAEREGFWVESAIELLAGVLCKQKVQRNAEKSAEACSYLFKSRF